MSRAIRLSAAALITALVCLGPRTPAALSQVPQTNMPADPGMYVLAAPGYTKVLGQIVTFRRTGSRFVSGVTMGIKARKENVQLLGPHAQTVVDGQPVFYFIPPRLEADAGVNAGDLVLLRLGEKKDRRQFEVAAEGVWRASEGISITHQIQLLRSEEKTGVYRIKPASMLGSGEYALYLARGEGTAAYVYDFSVDVSRGREAEATHVAVAPPVAPAEPKKAPIESNSATGVGTVSVTSEPSGADVYSGDSFVSLSVDPSARPLRR